MIFLLGEGLVVGSELLLVNGVLPFCDLLVGCDQPINLVGVKAFLPADQDRADLFGVNEPLHLGLRKLQKRRQIGFLQQAAGLGGHCSYLLLESGMHAATGSKLWPNSSRLLCSRLTRTPHDCHRLLKRKENHAGAPSDSKVYSRHAHELPSRYISSFAQQLHLPKLRSRNCGSS